MKTLFLFCSLFLLRAVFAQTPPSDSYSFTDGYGNVFSIHHVSLLPAGFDSVFWKTEFLPALNKKGFLTNKSKYSFAVEEVRKKKWRKIYKIDLSQNLTSFENMEELIAGQGYLNARVKIKRVKGVRKIKKVLSFQLQV
ncbi:MAG TPA: hypothetical protein VNZ86_14140 [Bacteroidia bacterium]|jgi:hypothetical protein|nr:hypothetical protein [Bacteroidia bacterium]